MPDTPKRIQLRRTKGWRMPANTVKVDRTTRWGNLYVVGERYLRLDRTSYFTIQTNQEAVQLYRARSLVDRDPETARLRGLNLACWCRLCPTHAAGKQLGVRCPDCAPCHADVLLDVANGPLMCEAVDV